MKKLILIRPLLYFYLLLQTGISYAQFVEFGPIDQRKFSSNYFNAGFTEKQNTSLTLPFWEDFSGGLDTLKWQIEGVSYTETIGIKPPSLGMAVFNGVDQNGRAYSQQNSDQGESDYLTSKPIDLSGIPSIEKETLYLSFYWQAGGLSESPDQSDRLILQVLDQGGNWNTLWDQRGGENLDKTRFFQEVIKINPEFQHSNFQFRFVSNGRQSGPFDAWLLDYIFLNTKQSKNAPTFSDRSLTKSNSIALDNFGAYPFELLEKHQTGKWSTVKNEFLNLENRFRAMEYSISVCDSSDNVLLNINSSTPFNPVPNVLERRSFQSRVFDKIPIPKEPGDLFFKTKLTSGDGFLFEINQGDTIRYTSVNFRSNDQVISKFPIRDFFAYDNGSADYAVGINQRSGQLAVKYSTPEQLFLKGISIYFSNPLQANQAIDLVVWSKLDSKPIYSQQSVIPAKIQGEEVTYFPFKESISVSGDFFIGYTQFTNDFIHVGLDKINDQGDKIFYNVGGSWVQNEEVKGSLMIRPHVSKSPGDQQGKLPNEGFKIFPNPVVNELNVTGEFTNLWVVDSFGREIILPRQRKDQSEILNFRGLKPGIYVVNLLTPTGLKSVRILLSN